MLELQLILASLVGGGGGGLAGGVRVDEFDELLKSAVTLVREDGPVGLDELDGGEALDLERGAGGQVVLGGVHLGDGD